MSKQHKLKKANTLNKDYSEAKILYELKLKNATEQQKRDIELMITGYIAGVGSRKPA